jgi:hypothetical protein
VPDLNTSLRAALAAEHAAIYAYGRVGVLLSPEGKAEAQRAEAVHRARRDDLLVRLDQIQASPEPAAPGYDLPFPVTDEPSALRLTVHVEEGVAATWRSAMSSAEGEARELALTAYSASAVQASRWRRLAGITPLTSAFPGRQG